jgi:cytochrome c-type biogenesis protein CcmH
VKSLEWFALLSLLLPAAAGAAPQPVAGRQTSNAAATAASLEREARQIETMLIAPCCWREQVSVHQSEAAEQVKREIREMLAGDMTRRQVLDAFVARYGARILAEPPDQGFGRVLYHGPWIVGLASAIGLVLFIRRVTRPAAGASRADLVEAGGAVAGSASGDHGTTGNEVDPTYNERLDEELRALD